jgi:circadian clock protein KaiC
MEDLIKKDKLRIVDVSRRWITDVADNTSEFGLESVIGDIKKAVEEIDAKRVVIDPGAILLSQFEQLKLDIAVRRGLHRIRDAVKKMGCTSIFTVERSKEPGMGAGKEIENFVLDGVIVLGMETGQNQINRTLFIQKIRGMDYRTGKVKFEITGDGIVVYPKIPVDFSTAKTDFKVRRKFGIAKLDAAMGGGIPQGHMLLVGGNTGTGKTTLGMHFLINGFEQGENGIWVALEEPVSQIKKTALEHNHGTWDFGEYEKQGKLKFVTAPLIDVSPDKLLYQIIDAVNEVKAKRIVIDSISSLESATMDKSKVREFWIQLSAFFKMLGVTCVANYLTSESFGAEKGQLIASLDTNDMRLSSVIDGIILLRYVEREETVMKLLNILKMRGSEHKKDIFRFEVDKEGFKLGEKFKI